MNQTPRVVQLDTKSAPPITVGDTSLTPQSQVLTVRLPFFGFVWNRPAAILVEQDGRTERIPIVDVTRVATLALAGSGFVLWLASVAMRRKRR
jgi:hypothetical protein